LERLPLIPQFRWKIVEVPFGLDRPVWVEADSFNPDYHIRRIGVPSPGGPAELADLVGHLLSYKINRDLPLWEMWVIEGLAAGRVAILFKAHHAVIDGVSGAGLGEILLDLEPTPRPAPSPEEIPGAGEAAERAPSPMELLVGGLINTAIKTPFRTARMA